MVRGHNSDALLDSYEPDPEHAPVVPAVNPGIGLIKINRGAEMLAYLEARTPLRMTAMERFADYYVADDVEGKKTGGRSCEPCPFPVGEQLPGWAARIQTKVAVRRQVARNMLAEDLGQLPRTPQELARREREDVRTKGSVLAAALLRGVLGQRQ